MAWIRHTPRPHRCNPPIRDTTIVPGIWPIADTASILDLWRCDDCGQHWHPARIGVRHTYKWQRTHGVRLKLHLALIHLEAALKGQRKPMLRRILAAAVASIIAVGVATTPAAAATPVTFKAYVTGSR